MDAHLILLPGLDGTGKLFRDFATRHPTGITTEVKSYPTDRLLSYPQLETFLRGRIDTSVPFWLLAESFSGPLAANLSNLPNLQGILFVASFVRSPRPHALRGLPLSLARWLPIPDTPIRWLMAGLAAPPTLAQNLRTVRKQVPSRVLIDRLQSVRSVDSSAALDNSRVPVLYLQAGRDLIVRPNSARWIQKVRPDTLRVTLDCHHLLLQTNPQEAWNEIRAFIESQAHGSTERH